MALIPLATQGNYLHIYDFRVDPAHIDDFVKLFNEFDYSPGNPMHKSAAQVKDGVLCRDVEDPQRRVEAVAERVDPIHRDPPTINAVGDDPGRPRLVPCDDGRAAAHRFDDPHPEVLLGRRVDIHRG